MSYRRKNGTGGITKMPGKRTNPYRVRITKGWLLDMVEGKSKQQIVTLGYYHTRVEAERALNDFINNPYEIDKGKMTVEMLYHEWFDKYSAKLNGVSSIRTITSAYKYISNTAIVKMNIRDVKSYHIKDCMDAAYVIVECGKEKGKKREASAETKARIKSMFNLMFDYAFEREYVSKNVARSFKIDKKIVEQRQLDKRLNNPFSVEEIQTLWDNVDKVPFADMLLIGIYMGWRPQELAIIKLEDIDFDFLGGFIEGGMKTNAGKGRKVPIHDKIFPLVKKRYEEALELGSEYLFNDKYGQQGINMTYDKYRHRFEKVIKELKLGDHHPHETRHSFCTYAKRSGIDDTMINRIMGHAARNIEARVYDLRDYKDLRNAVDEFEVIE